MRQISRSKRQDRLCKERNELADKYVLPKRVIGKVEDEMKDHHRIYYHRKGRYCQVTCSVLGKSDTFLIRQEAEGMEVYAKTMEKPKHKDAAERCPICGRKGWYISSGMRKSKDDYDEKNIAIYKALNEELLVSRIVTIRVNFPPFSQGIGWEQRVKVDEWARIFFDKKEMRQYTDWNKYSYYIGITWWDYKNCEGMSNFSIPSCKEYCLKEIDKTFCRYFDKTLVDQAWQSGRDKLYKCLGAYTEYPEIEYLQKRGCTELVKNIISGFGFSCDFKKKNPWEKYRLTKMQWNYLMEHNKGWSFIQTCKVFNRAGVKVLPKELEQMEKYTVWELPDMRIFEYTTIQKYLNYIWKHVEEYGSEHMTIIHYKDYIKAVIDLEYDLTNSIYIFPKNLRVKHDEMIERRIIIKNEKERKEKCEKYKNIEKQYNKLKKRYAWKEGEFIIRPAKSALEIIDEGRRMHHCVGDDNYLRKHDKGVSFILLMRRIADPETPYCTIEICGDEIQQWYQAFDRKEDVDTIQPWLDKYLEQLKNNKIHHIDQEKAMAM